MSEVPASNYSNRRAVTTYGLTGAVSALLATRLWTSFRTLPVPEFAPCCPRLFSGKLGASRRESSCAAIDHMLDVGAVRVQKRYLDHLEKSFMNDAPAFGVEYKGTVDEDAMTRALELLSKRHPVLVSQIHEDSNGMLLSSSSRPIPPFVIRKGGEDALLREMQEPWDHESALARIILIQGAERGYLAMRVEHAVFDGTSLTAIFRELWDIYSNVLAGVQVSMPSGASLPRSSYQVLQEHPELRAIVQGFGERVRVSDDRLIKRRVGAIQGGICLNRSQTNNLVTVARDNSLSVHALICGALLLAQRGFSAVPQGLQPMACLSAVNLRSRVSPQIGATHTTSLLGIHRAMTKVSDLSSIVAVGGDVYKQLRQAIVGRNLLLATEWPEISRPFPTMVECRLASMAISGMGKIPKFTVPKGFEITGLPAPVENTSNVFPRYSSFIYEGALTIRYVFPSDLFNVHEVTRIMEIALDLLSCSYVLD